MECMERSALSIEQGSGLLVRDMGILPLRGEGAIIELKLVLAGVEPERRVALAIEVSEEDEAGGEYPRGLRTLLVPAHHGAQSRDVPVSGIRFILPAELSMSGSDSRRLTVRAEAHYVDYCQRCDLAGY